MHSDDIRHLYSPNNAARALDISRSKIYDLMKTGALRFVKIGAGRRIPSEEIQRMAAEGESPQVAP